jgi:hypothetical protein
MPKLCHDHIYAIIRPKVFGVKKMLTFLSKVNKKHQHFFLFFLISAFLFLENILMHELRLNFFMVLAKFNFYM